MGELLFGFGTWYTGLISYSHHSPLRVLAAVLSVTSMVLTLVFGRPSWSGGGDDFSGFDIGDSDGGGGD
jgi:hypothetical protein